MELSIQEEGIRIVDGVGPVASHRLGGMLLQAAMEGMGGWRRTDRLHAPLRRAVQASCRGRLIQ